MDSMEQSRFGTLRGLIALFVLLGGDAIWFFLTKKYYSNVIKSIQGGSTPYYRLRFGLIAWILLCSAIAVQQPKKDKQAIVYGALVGLVVYGIFNSTNMAIFKQWTGTIGAIDTAWGVTICLFSAWVTYRLSILWGLYPQEKEADSSSVSL